MGVIQTTIHYINILIVTHNINSFCNYSQYSSFCNIDLSTTRHRALNLLVNCLTQANTRSDSSDRPGTIGDLSLVSQSIKLGWPMRQLPVWLWLRPHPHWPPGRGSFPRRANAGKPWKQGNGSYTRLKGLSRRVLDGRSTVLSQVRRDSGPAWEEKLLLYIIRFISLRQQ